MTTVLNIETRIANRAKSIFNAFGTIVNDFYLEAGIYFVGGFNASLVAWDIFTGLVADNQPLPYAILIAVIAFIAVEGLAVYLVGAAAKTNNGLLWFFSVVFAGFFTYAHYREMTGQGDITHYITLAIPFFVVVGYWARTVKADTENTLTQTAQKQADEIARQQRLEDEEIAHQRETERLKMVNQQAVKLAKLVEKQPEKQTIQPEKPAGKTEITGNLDQVNSNRKTLKAEILDQLPALVSAGKTNTEIGDMFGRNERTIRNYRKQMNGSLKGGK